MKVRFTPRARRRARLLATWWRANRPAAPALFDDELEHATEELAFQPSVGSVYQTVRGQIVRRLLLPRTEQHVYYVVDEDNEVIVIHSVWGARRGRAPKL